MTLPAGPVFTPNASRSPSARGRHLLLAVAELAERAHRVAQVGRLLEPLRLGRLAHVLLAAAR